MAVAISSQAVADAPAGLTPHAVPLIVHNSYFSLWSLSDKLTDGEIFTWGHRRVPMTCLTDIDGKIFRLIGDPKSPYPPLDQQKQTVDPTRTTAVFTGPGVQIELAFISPVLTDDLKLLARPISYLTWTARATGGKPVHVRVYFDVASNVALIDGDEAATLERVADDKLDAVRVGSVSQRPADYRADFTTADWGYCYLATGKSADAMTTIGVSPDLQKAFADGHLAAPQDKLGPTRPSEQPSAIAVSFDLGSVGDTPVARTAMLGYDTSPELQYFSQKLESFWKNETPTFTELLEHAWADEAAVSQQCTIFDQRLRKDASAVGGPCYADLLSLTYRQVIGAHHLLRDAQGHALYFSRECSSNSSVSTVDVSFPSSPFFLLHSTDLLKSLLVPILDYAQSPAWQHDSAPHSIGTFTQATGQRYGGGPANSPMPVEESGNMLLMIAAVCREEKSPAFAQKYKRTLDAWANHLAHNGYDTGEQLCTDDFRGRQLHNTNLSVKGICGLAAYAQVLDQLGEHDQAAAYTKQAKGWAKQWEREALSPDGTHFVQAFGQPDTFSFKYNMVWDKLLNLGLFAPGTYEKEFNFYVSKLQTYGVPMDHRDKKTKFDWEVWVACFADAPADRDKLLAPMYRMINETSARVPLTDYFFTDSANVAQFQARSVLGAAWMPMLLDRSVQAAWSRPTQLTDWAPQPAPNVVTSIIAYDAKDWQYTFEKPGDDWTQPAADSTAFSQGNWQTASFPLGNKPANHGHPGETVWPQGKTDAWARKSFKKPTLPGGGTFRIVAIFEDDLDVYLNGKPIFTQQSGNPAKVQFLRLDRFIDVNVSPDDFKDDNVIAVHSHSPRKGPALNFSFEEVSPPEGK